MYLCMCIYTYIYIYIYIYREREREIHKQIHNCLMNQLLGWILNQQLVAFASSVRQAIPPDPSASSASGRLMWKR